VPGRRKGAPKTYKSESCNSFILNIYNPARSSHNFLIIKAFLADQL
jgi:hypothetical protein